MRSELVARAICKASIPTAAASSGWPLRASATARRAPNSPVSRRDRMFPCQDVREDPGSPVGDAGLGVDGGGTQLQRGGGDVQTGGIGLRRGFGERHAGGVQLALDHR